MKRFYKEVSVGEAEGGWRVLLDGRPIRTQGGRPQVVAAKPLAEAMAAEWAEQGEEIDTAAFHFRDLADFALDAVASQRAETIAELVRYASTDTLCYRAAPGEPLHDRQLAVWEPLLAAAERRWDIHFARISGIMHEDQPAETLLRMEAVLDAEDDFILAALRMLVSLSASLVIGLAAIAGDADAEALWRAANLEEDWQAELWGRDAEAEARRQTRFEAFEMAMRFAALARAA
jgi:chaperone required for assembly of F1-ATPase